MKTTVIYHSADFDGVFCREIAKKFLPDAELIGWNHGDDTLPIPDGKIYILDLPIDMVFGINVQNAWQGCFGADTDIVWIDHHKSSIETHPSDIPGYRIDGVAACRLAWQWFTQPDCKVCKGNGFIDVEKYNIVDQVDCGFCSASGKEPLPTKRDFVDRTVSEPIAVRLAGEYDIWDKRDPDAELFQHGLRAQELTQAIWKDLLAKTHYRASLVDELLERGESLQYARTQENASIIGEIGFTFQWQGLTWLACNAARYNSHLFTAGLKAEHDACFGFKWTGRTWSVSLYSVPGKEHHDLSVIAKKYGGGGHRGACGFQTDRLPFLCQKTTQNASEDHH